MPPGAAHPVILLATESAVFSVDPAPGTMRRVEGLDESRPTCLSMERRVESGKAARAAWCGTRRNGTFRSDDAGASWRPAGLDGEHVTAVAISPTEKGVVWAGTEPSALWRTDDGGSTWNRAEGLLDLPSSSEWAFPPKPETHHVRWIACHPRRAGRLWLAIEAGALVTTPDGGRTWKDRVPGGPSDTHELAIHPERPETMRVSAGDGYFESEDGGASWTRLEDGLDVGYFRSVAIDPGDPDVVLLSGASSPRSTYVAGRSDGRLYRREGAGPWERVLSGWPETPGTIAPLIRPGLAPGIFWAADERGVHRSADEGRSWERAAAFEHPPDHLRDLTIA